jgi:hypothetical protein
MAVKPLLIGFLVLGLASAAAADDCVETIRAAPVATLAGVDAAGDPVLSDGRALRLVGLAPRQDAREAERFAAAIARWSGEELRLVVLGEADRWGRLPARLFLSPNESEASLAADIVAAGAAQALPEAAFPECGVKTKAAPPAKATRAAASTAAQPAGVLDGHDIAALKAQAGRLVAIEGRVASVGERAQRTYLNFSRRRAEAGAVMLSRQLWRELQAAGWTAEGLSGRRIRARGVLSGQDGMLLEVNAAAALELID